MQSLQEVPPFVSQEFLLHGPRHSSVFMYFIQYKCSLANDVYNTGYLHLSWNIVPFCSFVKVKIKSFAHFSLYFYSKNAYPQGKKHIGISHNFCLTKIGNVRKVDPLCSPVTQRKGVQLLFFSQENMLDGEMHDWIRCTGSNFTIINPEIMRSYDLYK